MDFKHPEKRGIAYDLLENLLDSIPARQKLLLMDACHSGEVDKFEDEHDPDSIIPLADRTLGRVQKGGNTEHAGEIKVGLQNSFELMQQLFADLNKGTGAIVISAASGTGYALEGNEWKNGVFTYSILSLLRNKPSGITVNQLKNHVIKEVERLTNGQQKPTSRAENLVNDFVVW